MKPLIFGTVIYLILGICYAIDFFHVEYEDMVKSQGMKVGKFFALTILTGLLWPLLIVMLAVMDIRGER